MGKKKEAKETQKTAFLAVNDSTLFNALHVSSENALPAILQFRTDASAVELRSGVLLLVAVGG